MDMNSAKAGPVNPSIALMPRCNVHPLSRSSVFGTKQTVMVPWSISTKQPNPFSGNRSGRCRIPWWVPDRTHAVPRDRKSSGERSRVFHCCGTQRSSSTRSLPPPRVRVRVSTKWQFRFPFISLCAARVESASLWLPIADLNVNKSFPAFGTLWSSTVGRVSSKSCPASCNTWMISGCSVSTALPLMNRPRSYKYRSKPSGKPVSPCTLNRATSLFRAAMCFLCALFFLCCFP